MPKIKKKDVQHHKIKIPAENNIELNYPVFCFKHLQTTPQDDHKFYSGFIERLKKISSLSWSQIDTSQRHSFGTEKIPTQEIKPSLPLFISPDVTHLTAFRANGDNRPFLGLRNGNIFHIVFLEERFGDVYDHGS